MCIFFSYWENLSPVQKTFSTEDVNLSQNLADRVTLDLNNIEYI